MEGRLNSIQLKLLNYLYRLKEPVSAQFLANNLGVSSKTIRNYLNNLNKDINQNDFVIESKTGRGYKLIIFNQQNFSQFIQENMFSNSSNIMNPTQNDRAHFIIRYLLSNENYIKIEEFEDLLYVNRITIKHSIDLAKEILGKFKLEIVTKSRYGIKIKGSEHDFRLIINYEYGNYSTGLLISSAQEEYGRSYHFDSDIQKQIEDVILYHQHMFANYNLSSSDVSTLARLIKISTIRNKKGHHLTYSEATVDRFTNNNLNYIAQLILTQCSVVLQCDFDFEDAILLTIGLSGFNVILSKDNMASMDYIESKNIAFDLVQYLAQINNFYSINKDIKLIDEIALHLNNLFIRSKYHLYTTQFDYEIKVDCSLMSLKLSMQAFDYLHEKYGVEISKDRIIYLAMIIHPVFGRFPTKLNKIKACCVSNVDKRVGKGIADRLMRSFYHFIEKIDVLELYELEKRMDEYDILFTSYYPDKLNFLSKHIMVFQIDIFWSDVIKRNIRYYLVNKIQMKNYQIRKYFRPEWIFKDVNIKKDETYIDVMQRYLKEVLINPEEFKQDLYKCEKIMASQPRDNVVFLSGLKSHTNSINISIFILRHPILWNKSFQKAQIIVYWDRGRIPDEANCFENAYIPHLLSEVFRNRLVIDELIKNADYERFVERIEDYFLTYLTLGSFF